MDCCAGSGRTEDRCMCSAACTVGISRTYVHRICPPMHMRHGRRGISLRLALCPPAWSRSTERIGIPLEPPAKQMKGRGRAACNWGKMPEPGSAGPKQSLLHPREISGTNLPTAVGWASTGAVEEPGENQGRPWLAIALPQSRSPLECTLLHFEHLGRALQSDSGVSLEWASSLRLTATYYSRQAELMRSRPHPATKVL